MPIPSVNYTFVLDDYRFRVRGSPSHDHSLPFFFNFFLTQKKKKKKLLRFGIWSTLTYSIFIRSTSVQFGLFGPLRSNQVHLFQFGPFQCTYLRVKNEKKKKVWVESIINYLSNTSCNYMITFYHHNNLLKRMRI